MQAYFTASITGKKQYLANYLKIIEFLTSKGYKVISDHIIKTTEGFIRPLGREERLRYHENLESWIKNSDFIIAEISYPSVSVGYEISLALSFGKPILILHTEGDPPSLLAFHKADNLICDKYTMDNLTEIIDDFLDFTRSAADTKFTFFINRQMVSFLDKISVKDKVPKSVFLRRLIEREMKRK